MHLHRTRGAGEGPDRQDHVSRDPVSPRGRERERGARGARDGGRAERRHRDLPLRQRSLAILTATAPPSTPAASAAGSVLFLYNAVVLVLAVCLGPVAALALAVRPAWRRGLWERLGRVPKTEPGRPAIWIHGASVGEISALAPIVRRLRHELPAYRLVVSTLTASGRDAAATRLPEADVRVLFPLDAPWAVRRALDAVAPRLVLFSETELWPNFLGALAARDIPAIMVSGQLSARAF